MTFSEDQFAAASDFAHTMIVVDDEPHDELDDVEPSTLVKPRRSNGRAAQTAEPSARAVRTHPLETKELIRGALDLGLVCSVVNPSGYEDSAPTAIAKAAKRADIVTLDWQMRGSDDGALATQIIAEILQSDQMTGGRLRLIAIYTGEKSSADIFKKIADKINASETIVNKIQENDGCLVNNAGLRLIWKEKALGNAQQQTAVAEVDLPKMLLREYAKLSNSLLSNVALATIAELRDNTHHVLSKFTSDLDGPYFHHLESKKSDNDAKTYAVSLVLSLLKSEVAKSKIISKYISSESVRRRVESMREGPDQFNLTYPVNSNNQTITRTFQFNVDEIVGIVGAGYSNWAPESKSAALQRQIDQAASPMPGKKTIDGHFSTVFYDSVEEAEKSTIRFSTLTSCETTEHSQIHLSVPPLLRLGSVLFSEAEDQYLLCLQATCDAVRGDGVFFFVPLERCEAQKSDIIVPHGQNTYVALALPARAYTLARSLKFGEISTAIGNVPITYNADKKVFAIAETNACKYRWLANVKYKRALKIAQKVSSEIARVGFDEFEPFRRS
jgi:hypothetical protein